MALSDLTRQDVLRATQECDRLGRDAFLGKYGFGQARSYLLVHDGQAYDSRPPSAQHTASCLGIRRSPPRTSTAAPRRSAACSPTLASKSERTRPQP
jgi:hypothetical protein